MLDLRPATSQVAPDPVSSASMKKASPTRRIRQNSTVKKLKKRLRGLRQGKRSVV